MSLEAERERIVEQLSAHYAEDHLTTQELEERFDRAYRAASAADLLAVVARLPAESRKNCRSPGTPKTRILP